MRRFEEKTKPTLYVAMLLSVVVVFVADLFTPLGIADWMMYLIPVALSLFVWRPWVPVAVASLATVLAATGFFLGPPGIAPQLGLINRGLGMATIWVLAFVVRTSILDKLSVRKDQWLQKAQTGLSEIMRGEQTLKELGERVLRFLAEYMGAQAGAFFAEEEGSFQRFATYAVPAESGVPERFTPGEGLLGQAVQDARILALNDLPERYFIVGSALGRSPPRHLLVAPVTADGKVNGAFELAAMHPVYDSDRELIEQLAESIGIAVRTARDRARMQQLLEETQRQAEELQAQGEELRVSNEELAEQSRNLKESQTRLELQHTEMEQTNQQLEEQTQLLEAQKENLTRAKAELERQARELAQASRYKSDFLANMSHELRTPLNSSLILARLLADNRPGNLTPEQVKYAQTIEAAGNDLLALITEVLDLSKIEAGRMELKLERVSLSRLLESLGRTFEPLAADKGLTFRMQVAPGTAETLETDPQRLEQVLKNILSNALKFTEQGEVSFEVGRGDKSRVRFLVRDTGIGIAAHQHQMIFEPFRQADGTTNRKYGGTGLGLSIAREITQLLGGNIEVTSEPGRGSTFTVLVPETYSGPSSVEPDELPGSSTGSRPRGEPLISKPAAAGPYPPTPVAAPATAFRAERAKDDREHLTAQSRVILVVEDDITFAGIVSDLAHELAFQCLIATTAEAAVAMAVQYAPSAVVLDIGLPDHSGLSVLDRLKADARTRHIPVHVISATDHSRTALAMGAAGYLLKPVQREQLVQAFTRLETRLTHRLRRVLVVEDDPVQLDSLRQLLASRDVETLGARTAEECLKTLRTSTVDCLVLDLNLPDASGFALLETLSHEEQYSFPPVIVYTGRELAPGEEERLRRYSKSIIIKGAKSPERLLDEVSLFLHQIISELSPEQQRMVAQARSRDALLENRRILIVEDDVRSVFAITSILEPAGVKVEIARNGREALEMLDRSNPAPGTRSAGAPLACAATTTSAIAEPAAPDSPGKLELVLMDIMMPEMDGLTAIREIRKRPEWKKLPIIALTAKAMKTDQEEVMNAGANDYMPKPLDVEKLLSLVRVWMPR
jgi:signal transduction histidine kinase/CheY-like chemotaxis protein